MRVLWVGALCVVLSSCAAPSSLSMHDCAREPSYARGARDALEGRSLDLSFSHSCSSLTRADAIAAYRDGFDSVQGQTKEAAADPQKDSAALSSVTVSPAPVLREPAAANWVCEVESNSKVFTGIGATRDEAAVSARATCGSHFQASYCTKVDCKQNL